MAISETVRGPYNRSYRAEFSICPTLIWVYKQAFRKLTIFLRLLFGYRKLYNYCQLKENLEKRVGKYSRNVFFFLLVHQSADEYVSLI